MTRGRLRALFRKELLDVARNPAALLPVFIIALVALVLPFVIALLLPAMTGQHLGDDRDLLRVSMAAGAHGDLSADALVQYFLFQQFLMVFLLMPITGAMALAAHAIIGEKQARTLEPLLATPVTTAELLVAKVLGALAPTLAISAAGALLYFVAIGMLADPGVLRAMMTLRTWILLGFIAPAVALVSLQAALVVSSRVNDARTAQQFGALVIVPLTILLVAQFSGTLWLSSATLALAGVGLIAVWVLLMLASVSLFDREAILTRWK
ncbi:MAG TPA: ABC transporter permease subunit [Vicinamibacterales bacterium]|jgi:ABC-2 type transport system permease protein|nr:ABC transporter permease subunit [Vicinamibacterales bacterium]